MKNLFKSICNKAREKTAAVTAKVATVIEDVKGDLATNTVGAIIVGVVVVGLLIVAINAFFPGFFSNTFSSMSDKLNKNW